jgi:type I thyroxine 5'-deiodinase
VAFYVVYIREAHPSDGWQLPVNVRDQVVHETPGNYEQRGGLAEMCVIKLGIELPALVDNFDDSTDIAYTGWPDRLYVIDQAGRVAYKSGPGPFGFKPDEMEEALRGLVPTLRVGTPPGRSAAL